MNIKNLMIMCFVLGALNASAQVAQSKAKDSTYFDEEESLYKEKKVELEEKKGIMKVTFGPTWTNAMVSEKLEIPFKMEENLMVSLNGYSRKYNYHLMYNPVENSVATLNGYRFSEKMNMDVFVFAEKNLNHEHQYVSIGVQETCRLGECEDFFVIFGEIGTDFHSPIFKLGISIIPQVTLWKR